MHTQVKSSEQLLVPYALLFLQTDELVSVTSMYGNIMTAMAGNHRKVQSVVKG
jgi:hypothetical protein